MKFRSRHMVMIFLLALGAFFVIAFLRQPVERVNGATDSSRQAGEDAFIHEVHSLQEENLLAEEPAAALPPVDAPQDQIPVIELETTDFDMGKVPSTEITKKQIKFYNRGKAPLELLNITTTCACTTGTITEDSRIIAPGGEGIINIVLNPAKVPGFKSVKVLTIFSNDPVKPNIQLVVRANLEPEFSLDPLTVNFGTVQKGEAIEKTVIIRQNMKEEFEIKEATLVRPGQKLVPFRDFKVELSLRPEAEWQAPGMKEYLVKFIANENIPLGAYQRYLYLITNLRRIPFYAYKVEGVVESFYTLDPSIPNALTLARPAFSVDRLTQSATLQSKEPLTISDLKFDEQFLEVTQREGKTAGTTHLDVTLKGVRAGDLEKTVDFMVKSGDKAVPETIKVIIQGDGPSQRSLQ